MAPSLGLTSGQGGQCSLPASSVSSCPPQIVADPPKLFGGRYRRMILPLCAVSRARYRFLSADRQALAGEGQTQKLLEFYFSSPFIQSKYILKDKNKPKKNPVWLNLPMMIFLKRKKGSIRSHLNISVEKDSKRFKLSHARRERREIENKYFSRDFKIRVSLILSIGVCICQFLSE
jgi:hypothetical protein